MVENQRRNTALARRLATCVWFVFGLSFACSRSAAQNASGDVLRKDYATIVDALRPFIQREMSEKGLPALSIAVVDDQEIVWAQGFGMADPKIRKPATAETVYRVGSVSKLFTDIAIMQLVERGELNLDVPITNYLPEFKPRNPFGTPITLRQLMSHRSGLLREPPIGHYLDPTEPSLAATVGSLNDTDLVFPPNLHTKYSNAAIAVVGYLLQVRSHEPYAKYLRTSLLGPMGLRHSSFEPDPQVVGNLAKAEMWTYDGLDFEAPTFQLGTGPAGGLYSTVNDLGHFVSVLLAQGRTNGGFLLKPATLEQMWSPQFSSSGGSVFGLGFLMQSLDGHRMVGHDGSIYGFATTVDVLPDDKLGVVVFATKDVSNPVTDRIAREALRLALARRAGGPLTLPPVTSPVLPDLGRRLVGRYGTGHDAVDIVYLDGRLTLLRVDGGAQLELRKLGEDLIVDGTTGYGMKVTPVADGIRIDSQILLKAPVSKPPSTPAEWEGLIGEYGWDHNVLYVFEKDGLLNVLIEWTEYDALNQISGDVFKFTSRQYVGERAVFTRDASGYGTQVQISGIIFKRRPITGISAGIFRIPSVRNLDEIRKRALADKPPVETGEFRKPDLVELASLDQTIKLDIRYATANNFLSAPIYAQPRAFLQRPAAEALLRAHQKLKEMGYGLLIHDAYRPWYVTKIFWEATPEERRVFVADPAQGSRHNRGCAVDLSLYELTTGEPIEMPGVYDEMSERSYAGYPGGTSLQRWHRELLRRVMEEEGFLVYPFEWWHFDYRDWQKYPLLNFPFDQLTSNGNSKSRNMPGVLDLVVDETIRK
jgi:CubicO group peptidase (beta-lactamase class C family)/D-alanyl-D-alanine dipeptidase